MRTIAEQRVWLLEIRRKDTRMILEISARNRQTHVMRKIRREYQERDIRKIEELLLELKKDEAVIEIRVDCESLL